MRNIRFTFKMTEEERKALRDYAQAEGVKASELVRNMLKPVFKPERYKMLILDSEQTIKHGDTGDTVCFTFP